MAKEALGFCFNVIPVASGKHISLKNAGGVTFVTYEDGGAQAITFKQSIAGASEKNLALGAGAQGIEHLYASNGIGGVWTRETSDADTDPLVDATALTKKDTTPFDGAAIYVDASWLDVANGFDSVECTIDGAGICVAIVHDLAHQRAPQNLTASAV